MTMASRRMIRFEALPPWSKRQMPAESLEAAVMGIDLIAIFEYPDGLHQRKAFPKAA